MSHEIVGFGGELAGLGLVDVTAAMLAASVPALRRGADAGWGRLRRHPVGGSGPDTPDRRSRAHEIVASII